MKCNSREQNSCSTRYCNGTQTIACRTASAEVTGSLRAAEVITCVNCPGAQFLLNAQELIVLGEALAAAWRTSLDSTCTQTHHKISNERVFGLSRPVRNHHTPAISH